MGKVELIIAREYNPNISDYSSEFKHISREYGSDLMETREYRENLPEMIQKMGVTYPYFNILYPAANTKYYHFLREDGTFERDYWQDFAENPTPNFEMPLPRTPELQAELQRTVDKYIEIFYGTS
jgi:hypothetical protein